MKKPVVILFVLFVISVNYAVAQKPVQQPALPHNSNTGKQNVNNKAHADKSNASKSHWVPYRDHVKDSSTMTKKP